MSSRRANALRFSLFAILPLIVLTLAAGARERVHIAPKFSPGRTLRYRIESSTRTTGKTTTPIANPEGGTQSSESIRLLVRLETLDAPPSGKFKIRATYEKSSADSESDALDLQASAFADQYNRLEGRSFEFTIEPGGNFTGVTDSTALPPGQSAAEPALFWLQALSVASTFPKNGVVIGQKWKSEQLLADAPLSGLIRRSESTYLRNEPCGAPHIPKSSAAKTSAASDSSSGECAVILTRFELLRRGSTHSDATPEEYRRNGLRTSGTWTGSGESLDSISLSSGLLAASTQSSTQNMDYEIISAGNGSSIHRVGKVQTHSEIALVPDQP
jgi:hypothetical protein